MLHRSKSKDCSSSSGPSYMSSDQVASYLNDLRSYKSQRPAGARPSPFARRSIATPSPDQPPVDRDASQPNDIPPRSNSAASHRRTQSTMSNRSMTPTHLGRPLVQLPSRSDSPAPTVGSTDSGATNARYLENGMRWMERQESASLRRALEDMDSVGEARIHMAAQAEASELVWKHQNPDAPYRYRDHLRKGSYSRNHSLGARSVSGGSRSSDRKVRDSAAKRSVSGSSVGSNSQPASREPSDSSLKAGEIPSVTPEEEDTKPATPEPKAHQAKIKFAESIFMHGRRKSSGGSLRKASGTSLRGIFSDPNDKIYEEPEEPSPRTTVARPSPVPTRRNPFARVQLARSNISTPNTVVSHSPEQKKFDKFEIQKNPPSQSRNPLYTSNDSLPMPFSYNATPKLPPEGQEDSIKMKDGKELRGDDIRAATSRKLKDRSEKLPTPVYVSDSPGRPIVSFKEPIQIELKEETSKEVTEPEPLTRKKASIPVAPPQAPTPAVPSISFQGPAPANTSKPRTSTSSPYHSRRKSKPSIEIKPSPPIPVINVPDSPTVPGIHISSAPSIPSIAVNASPPIPTIAVDSTPSVPAISVSSIPSIAVDSARPLPAVSISTTGAPPTPPPNRPLPIPTKRSSQTPTRPRPSTQSKPHWSPAQPARSSALCTSCALPIAGRIVSAAGARFHPECFRCHHCSEALECVAFYPEPDAARGERVSRIRARMNGEHVKASDASGEEQDRELEEQDGYDEAPRFYCHLDFHEFFSPRCKSCKTPIEGEVVVACGAEWHVGHFFCAQCGDPFDAKTPFVEKDGYAWCVNCHTNRYSTRCKKCRKPVIDTVVKALGAEWHETCFVCTECGDGFKDGRYFVRPEGNGQDVVCYKCEDRRLKA